MAAATRGQRRLEGLRRALEAAVQRDRHLEVALHPLDALDRLAERRAGREVEGHRDRRELALVVDGERCRPVAEFGHGAERDLRAVGAGDVDARQGGRIGLEFGHHLEHDLVLRARRVDRRHLALVEGVV